jgi:putative oxidoreductase
MRVVLLVARILFGGFFLLSGINHFTHVHQMAEAAMARGVPSGLVPVAGVLIILGGVHVLLGAMPRLGLIYIAAFLIPVTVIMHPFWAEPDAQQHMLDLVNFMKNVALLGGTFGLMAVPIPWELSVDAAMKKRPRDVEYGRPIPH